MRRFASIAALGAVMTLAACQRGEVARLCAAQGDPEGRIVAYAHDATGVMVHLLSDSETGQTTMSVSRLETPMAAALWSDADHTFQATSRGEVSPCDGSFASFVTVLFDEGDLEERDTQCARNALARLTQRILEASQDALVAEITDTQAGTPDSVAMACEWAYDRL